MFPTTKLFFMAMSIHLITARRYYPGGGLRNYGYKPEDLNFTCPGANEKPKVTYPDAQWPGNGESQRYQRLILQCVAAYPIYWDFIPPQGAIYSMKSGISPQNKNFRDSGTVICYKEELEIQTMEYYSSSIGRTGNYTCKSAIDTKKTTSAFVYSQDKRRIFSCPSTFFETYSRLINGKEWLIPCPANLKDKYFSADLGVQVLVKDVNSTNTTQDTIVMYPGDPSIRYDSKLGFLLKASNHSRPYGLFICGGVLNPDVASSGYITSPEFVEVNFTNYNVYPVSEFVQYRNYKQITIVCESDEEIFIDTTKAYKLKKINAIQTKNDAFNHSISYTWVELADPKTDGKEGEISCRVTASKKILHTWKHDVRKACNATIATPPYTRDYRYHYNPGSKLNLNTNVESTSSRHMNIRYTSCESKAHCDTIFRYFDKRDGNGVDSYVSYDNDYASDASIYLGTSSLVIECVVDTNFTTMILAIKGIDNFVINPVNWSSGDKINVTKIATGDNIFIGDSIPFLCKASKYFYSQGVQWELVYKNGSFGIVDSYNDTGTDTDYRYASYGSLYGPIRKASIFAIKDNNVVGVACSAHLWNSTKWETEKYDIHDIIDKKIWDENAPIKCDGGLSKPTIVMKRHSNHAYYDDLGRYISAEIKLASHVISNSEIVIQNSIGSFSLYCIAAYPVRWVYSGVVIDYPHRRRYGDRDTGIGNGTTTTSTNDTLHHCFQNVVHGYAYSSHQTGEYRCEKITDNKVFSYAYMYINASDGGIINRGEHIVVHINASNPITILPCKVSDPSLAVELYYHEDQGHYRKMNSSFYIGYDPKKGFSLETVSLNASSIYICTTANRTDMADALSFTFLKNESLSAVPLPMTTTAYVSQTKSFTVGGFLFLFFLIVTILSLQLWFLRKQSVLDNALTRIFGSYINMGSELIPNEFERHSNGHTQLIPNLM